MNTRNPHSCLIRATRKLFATFASGLMLVTAGALAAPPTWQTVTPDVTGTELYLKFSTPLCTSQPGVTHAPNYTLASGTAVNGAALMADGRTVRLTLGAALTGSQTLTITTPAGFEIFDTTCSSNNLVAPVAKVFTVTGVASGPTVYFATPATIGTDCGTTLTVHGSGFSASATVELIPGPIAGVGPVVNVAGTELTATFPGGIPAGNYSVVVKNTSSSTSVPYPITVEAPNFDTTWPINVGRCSAVKVVATGGGFCPGATFVASTAGGATTVAGTSVTVSPNGDVISGTFDFGTVPAAMFDLKVQNPGGAIITRNMAVYSSGIGGWGVYPKFLGDCSIETLSVNGQFCATDEIQLVRNGGGSIIPGTVTLVTPAASGFGAVLTATFDMVTAAPPAGSYHVEARRAGTVPWTVINGDVTVVNTATCPVILDIAGRTRVGYTKVNPYTVTVRNLSCAPVAASTLTVSFPAGDNPAFTAPTGGGVVSPANVVTFPIPSLPASSTHTVGFDLNLPNLNTTPTMTVGDSGSPCANLAIPMEVVASQDPNAKDGLVGTGAAHTIAGTEDLPYEIHFENIRTATAPAQDVFIKDRLNPAQFDLSTFSLGEIKFGSRVITPPPGLTSYSEVVPHDLDGNPATTADQMLLVVKAELVTDASSPDYGRLTWSYQTLDPLTMLSPLDPDLGFLPPNTVSPVGEGSVKFNVKLWSSVAPGAQFGSAAVIIFDANAPIFTNPWFNRKAAPVGLTIRRNLDQVEIEWPGTPGTFTLEQTSELGANAAWTPVIAAPVSVPVGLQRVTLTADGDQKYFRLRL